MQQSTVYDNHWFHEQFQRLYISLEEIGIHMGVADKFLFKQIALEEIERLSLDELLPQHSHCIKHSVIDCAILDGLFEAVNIYYKLYRNTPF